MFAFPDGFETSHSLDCLLKKQCHCFTNNLVSDRVFLNFKNQYVLVLMYLFPRFYRRGVEVRRE